MNTDNASDEQNQSKEACIGAVMVLGGGVGGMQAALDLADSGFKVYLVDKESSIGGVMAALDKTFPTNDCAMCTIAPRLVGVARHLNIEIITGAQVEELTGAPGNFEVKLAEKARYIDASRCTGCGLCEAECPITMPKEFDGNLSMRKAIFRRYPQAVPGAFAIDKKGMAPCRHACPAGLSVQGYMALTGLGKFREALEVIYRDIPFAGVCGRICPHFCEAQCTRKDADDPLSIRAIKRFLADKFPDYVFTAPKEEKKEKVALIGGGPSSITAAYHLRKMGYQCTIFEKSNHLGGMLRWGIPPYRLPREALDQEIGRVLNMGVEVKTGVAVGRDKTLEDLAREGYGAIYIATGLPISRKLDFNGSDSPHIYTLLDYFSAVYSDKLKKMPKKVLVIGGGNAAIDAARVSLRLGAKKATMLCLETRSIMPAYPEEIEDAISEGVEIKDSYAPLEYVFEGERLKGLKATRITLQPPEADGLPIVIPVPGGRARAVPVPEGEEIVEADVIIVAIGQAMDPAVFGNLSKERVTEAKNKGYILEKLDSLEIPLIIGGDLKRGPASAIEAMADGKLAAYNIDHYFRGEPFEEPQKPEKPARAEIDEEMSRRLRVNAPRLRLDEAVKDFNEVEKSYPEQQAIEEASRCLSCGICSECFRCETVCEAGALKHNMPPLRERILNVGSLILAPGFELFDPTVRGEYGFGRWKNVVTSLQFERILSASGPFMGKLQRPGDNRLPKSVAWFQCIGSREEGRQYCSSVCCMYATKQAILVKEHHPEVHAEIFYIDIRAFGKGFELFYERAKKLGVKYTQCRVSMVKEEPQTRNLIFQARDESGKLKERNFDMVVLSCGFSAPKDAEKLKEVMGIELDEHGFCKRSKFSPLSTSRDGIFACGAFSEPKDIPETVAEASGAACKAEALLSSARHTCARKKEYPADRELLNEAPRVGVFICHCGKNIGGVIDVPLLVEEARKLQDVVHAEDNLYTCSSDSLAKIKETIIRENLNRVVVSSCTPRTHEPLFQEALKEVGLNPYLFEMANIRDQCTWVHMHEKEKAYEKARTLIKMAVAKARLLSPLHRTKIPVTQAALVLGGGIAGMTAAVELASQGYPVYLVEKEPEIGGLLKSVHFTEEGEDTGEFLRSMVDKVRNNEKITLLTGSRLSEISGFQGNFQGTITDAGGSSPREIEFGAAIIATGAKELKPKEYLYGEDRRVMTHLELEDKLRNDPDSLKNIREVAFIQCVGSRNKERPYCSRICCTGAMKRALLLKKINPDVSIYILYRDIRTYGMREKLYEKAREAGIIFLRYKDDDNPVLANEGEELCLTVNDLTLGCAVKLRPELLILSAATVPLAENEELFRLMKIPLSSEGFFLEAHMKLRPVDFASDGLFLCGLAHYPKFIEETISQACAAVSRACTILSNETLEVGGIIAQVNKDKCISCLTCVRSCPYNVPMVRKTGGEPSAAHIEPAQCHGCGICASECPVKAITLMNFSDAMIIEMNRALLSEAGKEPAKV